MADFAQMQQEFYTFDGGEPRLKRIREAITEADQQNALEWQFQFRHDYIRESIFCGDRYFAMIAFPEMLSLYEQHEALQEDDQIAYDMLFCFKWIVEAAPEFPQISRSEIDSYFRLFKKMLLEQGKSLSCYYMKRCQFYMNVDPAIAAADFYRFLNAPLDDISDGRALYFDHQAMYYLSIDEEQKALDAAKLIFEGKFKGYELPQSTYHDFIRYYLEKHDYDQAMHYADLTEYRVSGDPYYLHIVGTLLSLYSITDIPRGLKLFPKHYELYLNSKNPLLKMYFAIGAYHLFRASGDQKQTDQFYQSAEEAVQKFDARNGTDVFAKMLHLLDDQFQN